MLEKMNAFAKKAADQTVEVAGQVKEKTPRFIKSVTGEIKRNKYAYGAMAVGVALFVVGRLTQRKKKK